MKKDQIKFARKMPYLVRFKLLFLIAFIGQFSFVYGQTWDNTSIRLWLRADSVECVDGKVETIYDLSGNGYNAVQANASKRPDWIEEASEINNMPSLKFDGSDDIMLGPGLLGNLDPYSLFVVVKVSAFKNYNWIYRNANTFSLSSMTNGNWRFWTYGTAVNTDFGDASLIDTYNIVTVRNDNTEDPALVYSLNGDSSGTSTELSRVNTNEGYSIGGHPSFGHNLNGEIVEILVFEEKLDETQKFLVENYLRQRYFPDDYIPPLSIGDTLHVEYGFCGIELNAPEGYRDFLWSTGDTTSTTLATKRGYYSLEATNVRGYRDIDSIFVNAPSIQNPDRFVFCPEDGLVWDPGLGSNYTYSWSTGDSESDLLIHSTGSYSVLVTDSNGCELASDTLFFEKDLFSETVSIFVEPTFCVGNELYLDSGFEETETYTWSTGAETAFITPYASGEYWVEAINANGCAGTDTVQVDIAGAAPYVEFDIGAACKNNPVVFTDETYDEGSGIVEQNWLLGSFGSAEGPVVEGLFNETGAYPIELTVLLDNGCSGTGRDTVVVHPLPLVGFDYDSVIPCAGNEVAYESQSGVPGNGTITDYSWQFGNGTTDTGVVGTTTFEDMGVQTVQLTVTSDAGCVDSLLSNVVVLGSPMVDFSFDTVCVGMPTVFNEAVDTSESGSVFYNWKFGDGFFSNFPNTSHTYAAPGVYTVQLTATGNDLGVAGCMHTLSKEVRVFATPTGGIVTSGACLGEGVVFTDMTIPSVQGGEADYIDSREWVLPYGIGQGPILAGGDSVQVWIAPEAGEYVVQLNFTTDAGCTGSASSVVDVLTVPEASFLLELPEVNPPFTVIPQNTSSHAQSYKWFVNDVEISNLAEPQLTFSDTGLFAVALVGMNSAGCNDTVMQSFYIIHPDYDIAILDIRYTLVGNKLALRALLANNGNTTLEGFDMQVNLGLSSAMNQFMDFTLLPGDVVEYTLPQMFEYLPSRDLPYVCITVGLRSFGILEPDIKNNDFCISLDKSKATFIDPYPNPVSGIVKLGFVMPFTGEVSVEISEISGKVVDSFTLPLEGGYSLLEYDTRSYSKGVYLIRYRFGGQTEIRRVVVGL